MQSVLQNWVMELPLRAQGTLLTGIRGCDLAVKPAPNTINEPPERRLVAFLRYLVLNPADVREVDVPGSFFASTPPQNWKASQLGHYPQHWYSHLMHCFEVVAYLRPGDTKLAEQAFDIYWKMTKNMHLNVEDYDAMIERLTEDRIANDTVVS